MVKYSFVIPTFNRAGEVTQCVSSLLRIKRSDFEVVMVDDGSTDDTQLALKKLHSAKLRVFKSSKNLGAAASRNKGAGIARGDHLFFLDSDTEVEADILDYCDEVIAKNEQIGMIAPMIYYFEDKKRIWYAGAWINMLTSQAYYRSINKVDVGQFSQTEPINGAHAPTAFVVPKKVFLEAGKFDKKLSYMGIEEPFIAKHIESLGYIVYFCPKMKVYHKIPVPVIPKNLREKILVFMTYISFRNPKIALYTSRNRILFMRNYSKHYYIFLAVFLPLSVLIYFVKSVLSNRLGYFIQILKGSIVGVIEATRFDDIKQNRIKK